MPEEPERVSLESPDLSAQKRAAFADLFPGVLADGVLDVQRLSELLDVPPAQVHEGRERYGLQWAGKQEAVRSLLTPSRGALVPDVEQSIDFDTAQNVFIEGDNLEVLKLLQKAYNDKVKLIFIDPPYNTGNDFVYRDDFRDGLRGYLEYTGQVDAAGNRTSANVDTSGRRHSTWLSMMYPRLLLARNLLTQDGVIFVTIDDGELPALRLLMDEIFGEENFVANVVWQSRTSISDDQEVSRNHNHVLVYSRDRSQLAFWGEPLRVDEYANLDGDPRGPWKLVPLDANKPGGDTKYEVVNPATGVGYWPPPGRSWAINSARMQELLQDGRIRFGLKNDSAPKRKLFLSERLARGDTRTPSSVLLDAGTTKDGSSELATVFGRKRVFDYPKPTALLYRLIRYGAEGAKDAVVLDFFAGSGTTANAVALQNAADGGRRRYVLVNLPEETDPKSEAAKAGYATVSAITLARLRAVTETVPGAKDMGLRTLRLDRSNFAQHEESEGQLDLRETTLASEHPDWAAVTAEVLLKEGVTLDQPWQRHLVNGVDIVVSGGVAVVLSTAIDTALVAAALKLKPRVVVFLEDGFAGADAVKANAVTNAKQLGITLKTV